MCIFDVLLVCGGGVCYELALFGLCGAAGFSNGRSGSLCGDAWARGAASAAGGGGLDGVGGCATVDDGIEEGEVRGGDVTEPDKIVFGKGVELVYGSVCEGAEVSNVSDEWGVGVGHGEWGDAQGRKTV